MKRSIQFFVFALILAGMTACGGEEENNGGNGGGTIGGGADPSDGSIAVSLWDNGGIREEPGKDGKWITSVSFGETVTYLDEKKDVEESGKTRTYIKVKLSDGKEGWANEYLYAMNAELGVVVKPASIYKRPEMTTITDKSFEAGDVIAVMNSEGDFMEVVGYKKQKQGWIMGSDNISTDANDVSVAVLYSKAIAESNAKKREEKLQQIVDNSAFSGSMFFQMAQDELDNMKEALENLAFNELMITGDAVNVRSEPNTSGNNKVFQLNYGDVCTVMDKGNKETIGGKSDYWYHISFNGQEGWVFGSFTSRAE